MSLYQDFIESESNPDSQCIPPCDTCNGTMTNRECSEMASHHPNPLLVLLPFAYIIYCIYLGICKIKAILEGK